MTGKSCFLNFVIPAKAGIPRVFFLFFTFFFLLPLAVRATLTEDTVASGVPISTSSWMKTNVQVDNKNTIHLTFYDPTDESLKYTKFVNGTAAWAPVTSITPVGVKVAPQNDLALSGTNPQAVYYKISSPAGVYRSRWTGTAWVEDAVQVFTGTQTFVSMAMGTDDNPRVAYYHSPSSTTLFALYGGGRWSTYTVFASSGGGPVSLELDTTNTPTVVFVSSHPTEGWEVCVYRKTSSGFEGRRYYYALDNVSAQSLATAMDRFGNTHAVFNFPSVTDPLFYYMAFNITGDIVSDSSYYIQFGTAPVFADVAVDKDDHAVVLVSTGLNQLNLLKFDSGRNPVFTPLATTGLLNGVGGGLALNSFDHAMVSCYSHSGSTDDVRFITEAARGLSVSGSVEDPSNAALSGVTLTLSGGIASQTVLTDALGAYTFAPLLWEGYYVVTPSKPPLLFRPGDASVALRNSITVPLFMGEEVKFKIEKNLFNPSVNEEAHFIYSILPGSVLFSIYNVRGDLIKNLVNEDKPGGDHDVFWDGRDDQGRVVATGIYPFVIESNELKSKGKIAVIK